MAKLIAAASIVAHAPNMGTIRLLKAIRRNKSFRPHTWIAAGASRRGNDGGNSAARGRHCDLRIETARRTDDAFRFRQLVAQICTSLALLRLAPPFGS